MKKMILSIFIFVAMAIGLNMPVSAIPDVCEYDPGAAVCQDKCFKNPNLPECNTQVRDPIQTGVNVFLMVIGALALGLIIWSGIRMMIFHNNDTKTWAKARNILLYAVIGLAIAALSFFIVNLAWNAVDQINPY